MGIEVVTILKRKVAHTRKPIGPRNIVMVIPQLSCPLISCGGLNKNGSHKIIGSGTIRGCDLVSISIALLEGVCHWGGL